MEFSSAYSVMSQLFNFPSHFKNLINFSFAQKYGIGLRRIKSAAGKHGKFKPNFNLKEIESIEKISFITNGTYRVRMIDHFVFA